MKRIQSTLSRALGRRLQPLSAQRKTRFAVLALAALVCSLLIAVPTVFVASGNMQKGVAAPAGGGGKSSDFVPSWQQAVKFAETPALRDLKPVALSPEEAEKLESIREDREKNEENTKRVKRDQDAKATQPFVDPAINNSKVAPDANVITNPIQNFDGPDMDVVSGLFAGGRFAPPDTNAAVGPNHVVITTNSVVQVFSKAGVAAGPAVRISTLLVGIANAADDDGDPIVLYDQLADRWIISQFDVSSVTANSTHQHIAVSKTGDPTGAYFAYDFLMTANRPADYPHMGVWTDGYYMSTNDFSLPVFSNPFQGAGLYCFERAKMLVGDPTALVIRFNTDNTHGGMLPSNLQGFTPPPVGTPNLFGEFDAAIFGAPFDLVRFFAFHADFVTPASSTLTQGPNIATAAFDARNPGGRADVQQPSPGEGLDSIADRLMHAQNFRVLPGGVQSIVLNFTVNVSGVNPTSSALYQAGVRWMELRRNAGTGVVSINQDATYAPGSGSGTGRDLWMAGVAQDGEGNIALAANGTAPGPTPPALNPTIIYTGRLSGDAVNTLPQGEVDGMSAVTKGVQTATANRWGDYSSLFVDPADECTFWGAFEYVDSPTATFDWNTRMLSFKVNPTCVTAPRGTINGTITNCGTGSPILNAVITTPEGFFRQTNVAGQFSMTVNPGTYTVTVGGAPGSGLGICTQTVTVAANGTATVNCCLGGTPIIVSAGATLVAESCTPANGVLDPNETVTISFCVQNTGGANTTTLVGTLAATGGVTSPSGPQNYGVVVAGGGPVCRNFTFTVNGTCGGTVTASIQFQDGATNLGTVTYTFTLGVQGIALAENFDGVTPPALPAGWVSTSTAGAANCTPTGTCALTSQWTTVNTTSSSAPNSAFHNDPTCVTDNTLDTPTFAITGPSQVTFRNSFNVENTFDGCVLEISINAGAFTDIVTAGGSFVTGGYNGTISVNFFSPIPGRAAWTGNSAGFITSTANLPAAAVGQNVKLRFRLASDCSLGVTGWNIDTVSVTGGFVCSTACGGTPCVVTCPPNQTRSNDPNQCGAVVTYPAPTSSGTCGTITCTPASGSFFPVGTTTVTCTSSGGTAPANGATMVVPEAKASSTSGGKVGANTGKGGINVGPKPTMSSGVNGKAPSLPQSPFAVLYSQVNNPAATATSSQNFEAANNAFDNEVADDFVVPAGVNWTIDQVFVDGLYFNGPGPATSVNVVFYSDTATLPGAVVATRNASVIATDTAGDFLINISPTVVLSPGTYWVGVQANQNFTPSGQWGWLDRTTTSNSGSAWRNPGGGFATACTPGFGRKTTCIPTSSPDAIFQILGTSAPIGGGTGPSCTFTVTVNDTQPPVITCSCNLTAVTPTPGDPCVVVNFTTTATDNCAGVTVVCTPPSGSCLPVGVTTVTCTATDASGNTATCSFTISVFNGRLQDDFEACNDTVLFNTITGDYRWCCHGTIFTGRGKITRAGDTLRLEHIAADRRVRIDLSAGSFPPSGNAGLQSPPGTIRCVLQDHDIRDDFCLRGAGACQGGAGKTNTYGNSFTPRLEKGWLPHGSQPFRFSEPL